MHSTTLQQNILVPFFFSFFLIKGFGFNQAEGVLQGEGRSISLLVLEAHKPHMTFCLLGAAMSYPTCQQSWRLQHSSASAPEQRRPLIWVCGTEQLKILQGGKINRKREKAEEEMCTTDTTCEQAESSHSSSFGKGLLKRWKTSFCIYLTHWAGKYGPDPALFTQDMLGREVLIQTQCWK